jgi:hypothetical protein
MKFLAEIEILLLLIKITFVKREIIMFESSHNEKKLQFVLFY